MHGSATTGTGSSTCPSSTRTAARSAPHLACSHSLRVHGDMRLIIACKVRALVSCFSQLDRLAAAPELLCHRGWCLMHLAFQGCVPTRVTEERTDVTEMSRPAADTCHVFPLRHVRMAYLAVVASHTVNGVAAIHSDIIRDTIFKPFAELFPEKFQNKTNGVTPRRWLAFCNPPLRELITATLGGDAWINDLNQLKVLARALLACGG